MRGGRDKVSKLVMLDLNETTSAQVKSPAFTHLKPFKPILIYKCKTKESFAIFLNQCCLCLPNHTWIAAINRNFSATWPGLAVDLIQKYLPDSKETAKGHMRQCRKTPGQLKPKHQRHEHRPQHRQHSSLMTRSTQQRYRLPLFHKVNVHRDHPQSIQQHHRLLLFHKAIVHGDYPLVPLLRLPPSKTFPRAVKQPSSRQIFRPPIKMTNAHPSTPNYPEIAHTRYS